MLQIKTFIFNPFEERGMVLWDESRQGVIVDPGCYDEAELGLIRDYVDQNTAILTTSTESAPSHPGTVSRCT